MPPHPSATSSGGDQSAQGAATAAVGPPSFRVLSYPPTTPSDAPPDLGCAGPILHAVQMSGLFEDSKAFVYVKESNRCREGADFPLDHA